MDKFMSELLSRDSSNVGIYRVRECSEGIHSRELVLVIHSSFTSLTEPLLDRLNKGELAP